MKRARWWWRMRRGRCWVCALPGGGHGGPVYWLQHWHLSRIAGDGIPAGHWLRNVKITVRGQ